MTKFFLLDDDELNNELVVLLMNSLGVFDVEVRTSGIDAIQYLEDCKMKAAFPDIMFVDLNMPGMKGLSFVNLFERKYKQYSPDTRIIILSNSILHSEKDEALKYESVIDYWNKPVTYKKLSETIHQIETE